ncbi:hypothetical protein LTR53_013494 [Teratosphaeriaceae sp. CCFEE 6253]|nr:hypothetical protein LTR53_013494 [Teratosphaeriaceae sp. CCFEE 6253]
MDQSQWNPRSDYSPMDHYATDNTGQLDEGQALQAYAQQHGHYDLLGPPNAVVPQQPTRIDAHDIDRFVRRTNDAPYVAGQRPQTLLEGSVAHSFPGALPAWTAPFAPYHPRPSGHSSRTASDSAYQSLNVTSGPSTFSYTGPATHDFANPFANAPRETGFDRASHGGTESILSEPAEWNSAHPGQQRKGKSRAKSALPQCWCGKVPKNRSDAVKHDLQHLKPFVCQELNCSRQEGFATQNDLQRHRGSVHHMTPLVGRQDGYVCIACTPELGKPPKFWPRKDNFKAHVKRKHPHPAELEHIMQL